ncbi:hypothetical protein H0H92_009625 [Tricholoma furcatifolium]|nr:hypothetical protein H0H92_009625 [Tricholoma furcatifolium]
MNEEQSLDALAHVLNDLSERPYDLNLHIQHLQLARSLEGMETQVTSACEMMVNFLAAGEQVWNHLLKAKENTVDLETAEGVEDLLALYSRAEADYLSITILQKHLEFLIERHEHYSSGENNKPDDLGDIFSTSWTRAAITEVVNKGINDLAKGHLLWNLQCDWELQQLESVALEEKNNLQDAIQVFFVARLGQPHAESEETLQNYSTFTTNHRRPAQYEPLLVTASKAHARALKSFERREPFEVALVKSGHSLEEYARYIAYERRAKYPDLFVMVGVFERAIAEAERRRLNGEVGAEEALRIFWVGLTDVLRINETGEDIEIPAFRRAVRSIPGCGDIWARYMRALTLSMGLVSSDVEQIVPVILARASYERRREDASDDELIPTIIAILESGIEMVHKASKTGDPKLRLEKYLASIYHQADLSVNAIAVWQTAAKIYKSSYLVWIALTETLIKYQEYEKAGKVFQDIHSKNIDWPEAIWEAWINFEYLYGTVDGLNEALDKIERAQYQEAEKAQYQAMQAVAEVQTSEVSILVPAGSVTDADVAMDVDTQVPRGRGTKREAEDEPAVMQKKTKIAVYRAEASASQTVSLGGQFTARELRHLDRDRENSTVFVGDLPAGVTEDEISALFKDCGKVREVKITELRDALVATVEFFDRDSIAAALTKDKKRLREQEIAVHLAWKSTLYVTNFPESADDAVIRDLFGQASAENALELHGRELEPNQAMYVFISNPERKKERTDQDANEREVYVAGLSKFTTQADLDKVFKTYGAVKDIRMATDDKGHSKGFAFIEYEQEKDALAALEANNHELKKRRIAVTLADSRVRGKARNNVTDSGLSRAADTRTRSVRIRNLPAGTQEGLLQQTLEKIAAIKRVEVFMDQKEAVVELESAAQAGKLLLRTDPIVFNGNTLQLAEEGSDAAVARSVAPPPQAGGLFVPRAAKSRPRAGLGHTRKPVPAPSVLGSNASTQTQPPASSSGQKGQDDFRKMLGGK